VCGGWRVIEALNKLRAAAAHRNYGQLEDQRFNELAKVANYREQDFNNREAFLRSVAAYSFGYLSGLREIFRTVSR
jgi:hypothetical protein